MRSPRVSIVMPVYNRGHLVKQAIQSILDQTLNSWELICIDDGSDDNTWEVLQNLKKDFHSLRDKTNHSENENEIITCRFDKHEGISAALKEGNNLAKAKIIIKQDSDDISLPDRLEVIYNFFKKYPDTELFYHAMYQTYDDMDNFTLHRAFIPALKIDKRRLLKEQYIPGIFAYTKKFIKEVPYRKLHCSEDWMLLLDAFLKGRKIRYLNQGLYEYVLRVDSNSIINEGTYAYNDDETEMKRILSKEYGIDNFSYVPKKKVYA